MIPCTLPENFEEFFGNRFDKPYGVSIELREKNDEFQFCARKYARKNMLLDENLYQMDINFTRFNSTACKFILRETFDSIPSSMRLLFGIYGRLGLDKKDSRTIHRRLGQRKNIDQVFKIIVLRGLPLTDQQKESKLEFFVEFIRELIYSLDSFENFKAIKV